MKKNNGLKILTISLAISGIISTASGLILNKMSISKENTKVKVEVVEKQIAKIKTNIPILKDITVEINEPISVDVKTYISNIEDISDEALKQFKLDTSLVNVTQAGKYTYLIIYKDKKYTGNVIVNEKALPELDLKLKNLSLKLNSTLSEDLAFYIENTVPQEAIATMKLDLSQVNTKQVGNYRYTITYNQKQYTGNIQIYEEVGTIQTSYTIQYVCGTKTLAPKTYTKNGKVILQIEDIQKPEEFTECSSEIDREKTTINFPISVSDKDTYTIHFKLISSPSEKQNN